MGIFVKDITMQLNKFLAINIVHKYAIWGKKIIDAYGLCIVCNIKLTRKELTSN